MKKENKKQEQKKSWFDSHVEIIGVSKEQEKIIKEQLKRKVAERLNK